MTTPNLQIHKEDFSQHFSSQFLVNPFISSLCLVTQRASLFLASSSCTLLTNSVMRWQPWKV